MNDRNSPAASDNISVKRAKHGSVVLYEVREDELETLERGSAGIIQLNFAIFIYTIALTSLVVLLTTEKYKWEGVQNIFWVGLITGLVMGTYFMIQWIHSKKSVSKVASDIRNRLNGESIHVQNEEDIENQPNVS